MPGILSLKGSNLLQSGISKYIYCHIEFVSTAPPLNNAHSNGKSHRNRHIHILFKHKNTYFYLLNRSFLTYTLSTLNIYTAEQCSSIYLSILRVFFFFCQQTYFSFDSRAEQQMEVFLRYGQHPELYPNRRGEIVQG